MNSQVADLPKPAESADPSYYDIHGLTGIAIAGSQTLMGKVMDETLQIFKCPKTSTDLSITLGRFPSDDWEPKGYTVGDRLLYDFDSDLTTVFRRPTTSHLIKSDIEYVIRGDITTNNAERIEAFVPYLPKKFSYSRAISRGLARRSFPRTILAVLGNSSIRMEQVELEAARLRLAILEPFLYYQLPFQGASLAHASVVCSNGSGLMIAGSGHIGKTALSLEMVKRGFSYMGDDLVIVNDQGQVLSYSEPLRIQEQHLSIFPGLEKKVTSNMSSIQRFYFKRSVRASPGEVLNLMPRLPISKIVDGARVEDKCRLDTLILVRKGGVKEPLLEEVDVETATGILAAELFWEFEAGLWRHTQYMYCPACAKGQDFIATEGVHHELIQKVLHSSIKHSRTFRLKVPYEYPIRGATKYIDQVYGKET